MERKLNLSKGQEVVARYTGERIRYVKDRSIDNIQEWTTKGIVTKVGRKYIEEEVKGYPVKFDIEFNYVEKVRSGEPSYKLYLSIDEIINEVEAEQIYSDIRGRFDSWRNNGRFTLDQLQRIESIILENSEN